MEETDRIFISQQIGAALTLIEKLALAGMELEAKLAAGPLDAGYVQLRTQQLEVGRSALASFNETGARVLGEIATREAAASERRHALELRRAEMEHELALRRLALEEARFAVERDERYAELGKPSGRPTA